MTGWDHKDLWRRFGRNFMVEVSRHTVELREESSGCFDAEGPHRWAVYAYIYPKHQHFMAFNGDAMHQDAAAMLHFHGGPSLLRRHFAADGSTTSVQVGADYNHLHDWRYTQMETANDAQSVFSDAAELFEQLDTLDTRSVKAELSGT